MVNRTMLIPNPDFGGVCRGNAAPSAEHRFNRNRATRSWMNWEPGNALIERQITASGVHVWPFRAGFPLDCLGFTCTGPNVCMNRHDYCEIIYVHSGSAIFELQDRSCPIHCGDLVVVGPSLYHRIFLEPRAHVKLALIFFEPELLNDPASAETAEYLIPFFQQRPDFPMVIPAMTGVPGEVFPLMQKIRNGLPADNTRARLAVKTYLKMILVVLLNHYAELVDTREAFNQRETDLHRLEPVFSFLESDFSRHVGVSEAARRCAMSCSHFMFLFKRVTGQSFIAYANNFRVAKAQELLRTTEKSISDISQDTGFCDQSHFGSTFRRLVGMTPRAYRSQFGKKRALTAKPGEQSFGSAFATQIQ